MLADDHTLFRAGLRALLEGISGVEVVGEAADGQELIDQISSLRPHVVLMDISMPILNGLEAARRLKKTPSPPRVVVLSMHADPEYVRQALRAGAVGYLLKTADRRELELALDSVSRGEVWLSPAIARSVVDDVLRSDRPDEVTHDLTPRQREVLQLIAEGQTTKQIARRLRLSVKTVDCHRAEIMKRLDIHHVAGLVRYAVRAGIVSAQ
jgi:DNA-binding NarL/FixJ family response regulator